jgi:hypothetical protein
MLTPTWETIAVRLEQNQYAAGADRLAMLFRWRCGEAFPGGTFIEPTTGAILSSPGLVHWHGFPLQDAIDAANARSVRSSGVRRKRRPLWMQEQRSESAPDAGWVTAVVHRDPPPCPMDQRNPHWTALRVWKDGRFRRVIELDADSQLAELRHWRRGHVSPGIWFVDIGAGTAVDDPTTVDWAEFPEQPVFAAKK